MYITKLHFHYDLLVWALTLKRTCVNKHSDDPDEHCQKNTL